MLVANLFLHHFSAPRLAELCNLAARHAQILVAIEPRRSTWALVFSHLVGLIGCNRVTRHDAPVSVRAGFHGGELSQSWSGDGEWSLEERAVGLFSHLFIARRTGRIPGPDTAAATQGDRSPSDRSGRARSLYTQRRKSSRQVWGPGLQFPVGRVPPRGGTSIAVYVSIHFRAAKRPQFPVGRVPPRGGTSVAVCVSIHFRAAKMRQKK